MSVVGDFFPSIYVSRVSGTAANNEAFVDDSIENNEALHNKAAISGDAVHSYWIHFPLIIVTNVMVVLAVFFIRQFHTPHNIIVAGIAVMDLLTGLLIPLVVVNTISNSKREYIFTGSKITCYMIHSVFLFKRVALAYVFLMSLERFLAIKYPYQFQIYSSKTKTVLAMIALFGITLLEFVFALSFPSEGNDWIDGLSRLENHKQCAGHKRVSKTYDPLIKMMILFGQTLVSLFLTIWVGWVARKQRNKQRKLTQHIKKAIEENKKRSLKQILINVYETKDERSAIILVNCLYLMLWIPYCALAIADLKASASTVQILLAISDHCLLINSWINAFIYAFSKKTYRKAFHFFLTNYPSQWTIVNEQFKETSYRRSSMKSTSISNFTRQMFKKENCISFNIEPKASTSQNSYHDRINGRVLEHSVDSSGQSLNSSEQSSTVDDNARSKRKHGTKDRRISFAV